MIFSIAGAYPVTAAVSPRLVYYPWIAVEAECQSIVRAKLAVHARDAVNRTQDASDSPHRYECFGYLKGMKRAVRPFDWIGLHDTAARALPDSTGSTTLAIGMPLVSLNDQCYGAGVPMVVVSILEPR
jgi:hypothetical protein